MHTANPWKNAPGFPTFMFLRELWMVILDVTLNEYTPEFGRSADFSVYSRAGNLWYLVETKRCPFERRIEISAVTE